MQTYQTKRKSAPARTARPQAKPVTADEMLHLSGAGAPQPMSPALREKFEPGFSADFSNIRISRGHIPEEMGVQAVARGTDILLDSSAGMDVLGHELAHVVQQAQGRVQGGYPVVENAALEHEADVMGARVASGLTAQAGPQNGFGGELTTIAPMSGASAPAQCKSKEEKEMEKTQISEPTLLKLGSREYANTGLDSTSIGRLRQESTAATTQDVATAQMLNAMEDSDYVAKIAAYTGGTPEEIASKMGTLVGQNYAVGAAKRGAEGGDNVDKASRFGNMFRGSELYQANFGKFAKAQLGGTIQDAVGSAVQGKLEQRPLKSGKGHQDGEMDEATVDTQFDRLTNAVSNSAPILSAVDGFFGTMKQSGLNISNEELEKKMSSEIFLRGINPAVATARGNSPEEQKKIKALSRGFQTEASDVGKAHHQNYLVGRAARAGVPAPAPAPKTAAPAASPGPSLAPKLGQQYTTQADLPQSGDGWSHTGSWKHTKSNYDFADNRMDIMPGGSDASGFSRFTGERATPAPKKKKNIFSRLFGR